jgi:branched-chain amino acid transport system substrate-binding protein
MKPRVFFIISCVFSFSVLIAGCKKAVPQPQSVDKVLIGEILTLTGPEAGIGIAIHQGTELALQELNATGGINGKKVEIITLDDQGKPEEAAAGATKLITQHHVTALLGASASSRSIVVAGVAQKYLVPMITPTSTHPKVTEVGDHVFRVCYIDPYQGKVMADLAVKQLHATRIAVLRDVKSDYSVGLSDFFRKRITEVGADLVSEQSYSSGDIDYKSQLTAIRAKSPQAIFIPGYYTDVALIARQARELGIQVPLLGGDGWGSPKLIEIAGSSIDNSYYSSHFSSEDSAEFVQKFVSHFKERFNLVPNGLSALGFDSLLILANAMSRAEKLSSEEIRIALAKTQNYEGITGKISIDPRRNASKSAVILKVDQGQIKYFSRMAADAN